MHTPYDYLVVGAGLYGAAFARQMADAGKSCLVIDRRPHIAGNAYTRDVEGILVHTYGPHIFHTARPDIWAWAGRFTRFNHFVNAPLANYHGTLYNLPFNMNTFYQLWGIRTPEAAREKLAQQCEGMPGNAENLRDHALHLVGPDIYERLIRGYTEKQWGRPCEALPAFLLRRIPLRFTYDNNYFDDPYQGIPEDGYTTMVSRMLDGIEVRLGIDYLVDRAALDALAARVVYTGPIDAFFGFSLGTLAYRSLRFETETLPIADYQGNAVINYTDRQTPFTRILEHKHFAFGTQPHTIITREYPAEWTPGAEAYYPVNDAENQALYARYRAMADALPNIRIGGRLGEYRYLNMDQVIAEALKAAEKEIQSDDQ